MSSAVILKSTKPADNSWWRFANPQQAAKYTTWLRSQPGFISAASRRVGSTAAEHVIIFDTVENRNAYLTARAQNEDWQNFEQYMASHGHSMTQELL